MRDSSGRTAARYAAAGLERIARPAVALRRGIAGGQRRRARPKKEKTIADNTRRGKRCGRFAAPIPNPRRPCTALLDGKKRDFNSGV